MIIGILLVAVVLLAWSNGANDNFKGVATLYGSATTTYRQALVWATTATAAGSLLSVLLAASLAQRFAGKGLLDEAFLTPTLLAAVGVGAALTVLLATQLGMPTSTTHALTGALVGAGLAAAGTNGVGWSVLATKFAQPLLLSPVLAVAATVLVYPLLRFGRQRLGVNKESCLCVVETTAEALPVAAAAAVALPEERLAVRVSNEKCQERYSGNVFGINAQKVVDATHYLSGGAVCFARAVNDTPKIAALFLGVLASSAVLSTALLVVVALVMALGGWFHSRRVAETMSLHITELNTGQGLTANLMTAGLVLGASRLGVPVSTTHVSCGSIFGIGLVNGERDWKTISQIGATWVTTLPVALAIGAGTYLVFQTLGRALA